MNSKPHELIYTPAWLMKGFSQSAPGFLMLEGGRLSFSGEDAGDDFTTPLADVRGVKFPWYYFGGGFKATVNGKPLRLSLVKPNGVEYASARVVTKVAGLAHSVGAEAVASFSAAKVVMNSVDSIREGRKNMRLWRAILTAQ